MPLEIAAPAAIGFPVVIATAEVPAVTAAQPRPPIMSLPVMGKSDLKFLQLCFAFAATCYFTSFDFILPTKPRALFLREAVPLLNLFIMLPKKP